MLRVVQGASWVLWGDTEVVRVLSVAPWEATVVLWGVVGRPLLVWKGPAWGVFEDTMGAVGCCGKHVILGAGAPCLGLNTTAF